MNAARRQEGAEMKGMSDKTQYAAAAIYSLLGLLDSNDANKVLDELDARYGRNRAVPALDLPKVYTVQDLAKRWRLHVNTVRLMVANDKRLGAYLEGRKWLVRQDTLDTYERLRAAR